MEKLGGVDAIDLHVQTSNEAAVAFYTALGFEMQRRKYHHYHFEGAYHDAYKMCLPLTSAGRALLVRRRSAWR